LIRAKRGGALFWGAPIIGHFKKLFWEERAMLNKKLVLGSLAGATLLVGAALMVPATADAGLMTGVCSKCHTMHNSQGGKTMFVDALHTINSGMPAYNQLLAYDGCVGCHARTSNDATGRAATDPTAPQVGPLASANVNAGGYFGAVTDANQHNITDAVVSTPGVTDATLGTVAPGGTDVGAMTCTSCHGDAQGGHHTYAPVDSTRTGGADDGYRMLTGIEGQGDINYATASAAGANVYNASSLNGFCAGCHGGFHTLANQGGPTGAWVRHPTDVKADTFGVNYDGTASNVIPTGAGDNFVMCVSCHNAHGSSQADLLRFTYNATDGVNYAGDANTDIGCETCHGPK
jgi:hypothetical protein